MKRKRKILFVAEELAHNGAMKSLIALLKALDPEKYDISLFLFWHTESSLASDVPENVTVLPEIPAYRMLRMPLKDAMKDSAKRGRLDLTVLRLLVAVQRYRETDFKLWPLLPSIPGEYDLACSYADGFVAPLILKKVNARATACWIHYMYSMMPQPEYVYEALRQCSACVPVSIEAGKVLGNTLGTEVNMHVIHNLTDADECKRLADKTLDFPMEENKARIVSIGRVTEAKRFDVIPETAKLLKDNGLDFEWLIAGEGNRLAGLRQQISDMNLGNEVRFLGQLDNPMPLLKSADVFVNPSLHESWGMTVSEALCLGKVVITSDLSVFAEQIEDGKNGFMRPATPESISQTILNVLNDNALRSRIEENASRYPHTRQSIVREFDTLVENVVK